jgi:hypothetical protein
LKSDTLIFVKCCKIDDKFTLKFLRYLRFDVFFLAKFFVHPLASFSSLLVGSSFRAVGVKGVKGDKGEGRYHSGR